MKVKVMGFSGAYPAANGACSGYLVSDGDTRLMLDFGSGVLPRLMALMDPADLSAIVMSHWHYDHASDLLPLAYYIEINKLRLRLVAPAEPQPLRQLIAERSFELRSLAETGEAGGLRLESHPVKHPVPAYALKLTNAQGKVIVYTGDAVGGEGLKDFCREADLLICDAAFTRAQWNPNLPHFSAAQAGELARDANAKRLMITHFMPGADVKTLLKEAREAFPDAFPARLDLTVDIE
ncbi:MAG: MBL fold metallo-hydrolase [Eubacteriales bacterium]|nr:MBL fold metallo-hydrolase [Eubacteriales bacterium]